MFRSMVRKSAACAVLPHCATDRSGKAIHVMCVHLGLREAHRQAQLAMLAEWVNGLPDGEPVLVAGDFNDWRQKANHPLKVQAGLDEISAPTDARRARFRCNFLYYDWTDLRKNASASAPTALPLRTCGDTF
ncbi:endonuclease/exonuclease/phosphatase family protein [Escherichia coli]